MITPIFRCQCRNHLRRQPLCFRPFAARRFFSEWRTPQALRPRLSQPAPAFTIPRQQWCYNSTEAAEPIAESTDAWALPETCHGCGALTQWVYPEEPGYYTVTRKPVKQYIRQTTRDQEAENAVSAELQTANQSAPKPRVEAPFCDRCHNLINHGEGSAIPYPTLSYIRDLIDESPFNQNHVYHVLDAADFPLSVIPNLDRYIPIQPHRSQNRRSQAQQYGSNRHLAVLNFIITRADLLSNVKPQADSLMQDMVRILREALDRKGHGIRLGNVHMVSSYRGWWTKEIKEGIWHNGGGVWMVGKVNVGKSKLITSVFPKSAPKYKAHKSRNQNGITVIGRSSEKQTDSQFEEVEGDEIGATVLLPPLQKEVPFPNLPIDSTRPGTTASPIRIPFDRHRGEVIDLPGLYRSGLDEFVQDKHKSSMVMTSRPKPERLTIKPTQSLLLGGLIAIKPLEEQELVMAAPFVSLEAHVTSKDKAAEMLAQQRECPTGNIAKEGIGEQIASAGIIELKYDVTSKYSKAPVPGRIELYRVMGVDILIEGCGWVELTCQVRTKSRSPDDHPKVEIFSPRGEFVGSRMPLNTFAFSMRHRAEKERQRISKSGVSTRRTKPQRH